MRNIDSMVFLSTHATHTSLLDEFQRSTVLKPSACRDVQLCFRLSHVSVHLFLLCYSSADVQGGELFLYTSTKDRRHTGQRSTTRTKHAYKQTEEDQTGCDIHLHDDRLHLDVPSAHDWSVAVRCWCHSEFEYGRRDSPRDSDLFLQEFGHIESVSDHVSERRLQENIGWFGVAEK